MSRVLIVGGGISGLTAAYRLLAARERGEAISSIELIEAEPVFGGKILTERRDGFLVEAGADSFIIRKPAALELVKELGLAESLRPTSTDRSAVYVLRRGELIELPRGLTMVIPTQLGPLLRSPLLSIPGRLRVAMDFVRPRRRRSDDESVADFVRRRFGAEYLDRLAGPLFSGIHSTAAEHLSLNATFPFLGELERRHGSVIRGMRALHRGVSGATLAVSSRVSLTGGLGQLIEALVERLRQSGASIVLSPSRRVVALAARRAPENGDPSWRLDLDDGSHRDADQVVLAVPPAIAARIVSSADPSLSALLEGFQSSSTATVSLGFLAGDLGRPLDGLGYIVPASEGRPITACTWSSSKFEGRAPEGKVLVRAYVGGARNERLLEADDADLVRLVRRELASVLGLKAEPVLARVHRFKNGNPQYAVGHRERVAGLAAATPPGLWLIGGGYRGVGIPDCIADASRVVDELLSGR